jgi:hypothetical protein
MKGSANRRAGGREKIEENLWQFLMLKRKCLDMEQRGRKCRYARESMYKGR